MSITFTSEVFARHYLQISPEPSVVAWAENMVLAGYENDDLYVLVGENEALETHFINDTLRRLAKALGVPSITSNGQAAEIIATADVRRFGLGYIDSVILLSALANMYHQYGMSDSYWDFYDLANSKRDLQDFGVCHNRPELTLKNFEPAVRERCLTWLQQHRYPDWLPYEPDLSFERLGKGVAPVGFASS